jgi:hypothetical protein
MDEVARKELEARGSSRAAKNRVKWITFKSTDHRYITVRVAAIDSFSDIDCDEGTCRISHVGLDNEMYSEIVEYSHTEVLMIITAATRG